MSEDFDDMYGSVYFSAADLKGRKLKVKITDHEVQELRDKNTGQTKRRIVLSLGDRKPWVVNKTNAVALSGVYGKNPVDWEGQTVELFVVETAMGPGIRCTPLSTAKHAVAADADEEDDGSVHHDGESGDELRINERDVARTRESSFKYQPNVKAREARVRAAVRSKERSERD